MPLKEIKPVDDKFKIDKKNNYSKLEIEIGDVKQSGKNYPQAKFKYWDNEVNFSVRHIYDNKDSIFELKDNKVNWKSKDNKREVNLYELTENDGFEIEVILNEKPESNVIEYSIETKDLDFFYQPELTPEEILEGAERPSNIIGSYAVYHKTKKNHNYQTGKVCHIYRPYVTDSSNINRIRKNNRPVWCDLNINEKNKLLTITIPQDFLDNATYPVIVDPTFGNTSGGSSYVTYASNTAYFLYEQLNLDISSVNSIKIYTYTAVPNYKLKGCFWNSSKTLLSIGSIENVPSGSNWITSTFSTSPTIVNGNNYYFGMIPSSTLIKIKYDTTSSYGGYKSTNNYSSPTNLGTITSDTSKKYSIYFDYTEGVSTGPGTPISTKLHYFKESSYTNPNITSDNFDDNSLAGFWDTSLSANTYTITETENKIYLQGNDYDGEADIYQVVGTYNFDISVKLVSKTYSGDYHTTCGLFCINDTNWLGIYYDAGGDYDWSTTSSGNSDYASQPYTPAWFRIKYIDEIMTIYISPDGTNWTQKSSFSCTTTSTTKIVLTTYSYDPGNYFYAYFDDFVNIEAISSITTDINLYDNTTDMTNYISLWVGGAYAYAHLRDVSYNNYPSDLRIRKGGVTYMVATQYDVE